ncbi:uncharacterized protein LOC18421609 [Amborella trichopoda]|uniref:Uncharacterized protein n=1 Tax=Amborella trichopoda TaxID=13333 RepID=W1NE51_AMBTC|nr:uncharacterized protein LOC18421609 [Amborella trichopoda]ERM93651.1 hypothetical protein AMTR_s00004p00157920 [Amborella trichopoda]|eukprot:XP_006826414.1 uncharacterized protein LOC18421609 [Amborella trichopoda]
MARQPVSRPDSGRRKPLKKETHTGSSFRFAEVAGATAAECAAVFCCCPCGLLNLLILAAIRLPAGLFHRALKKRRRRSRAKRACSLTTPERHQQVELPSPVVAEIWPEKSLEKSEVVAPAMHEATSPEKLGALSDMEEVEMMWGKLHTGFWRTPSDREQ